MLRWQSAAREPGQARAIWLDGHEGFMASCGWDHKTRMRPPMATLFPGGVLTLGSGRAQRKAAKGRKDSPSRSGLRPSIFRHRGHGGSQPRTQRDEQGYNPRSLNAATRRFAKAIRSSQGPGLGGIDWPRLSASPRHWMFMFGNCSRQIVSRSRLVNAAKLVRGFGDRRAHHPTPRHFAALGYCRSFTGNQRQGW